MSRSFAAKLARILTVDPWSPTEAAEHSASARAMFRHERLDHMDDLVRDSCTACALSEDCPDHATHGTDCSTESRHPRHCAWERLYVEAGRPIPQRYLAAFCETLAQRTPYAKALRTSVRTFGLKLASTANVGGGS